MRFSFIALLAGFILAGCGKSSNSPLPSNIDTASKQPSTGRWYSVEQVDAGKLLFREHCAVCHGKNAEATPDWKTTNSAGQYPPPPLNGSAHAWHHPIAALKQVILKGGALYGGQMPAWEGKLTNAEIYALIASFQSYWSDDVYDRWLSIEQQSK